MKEPIIATYLAKASTTNSKPSNHKFAIDKNPASIMALKHESYAAKKNYALAKISFSENKNSSPKNRANALLILLHEAIAAQQVYPAHAALLNQVGTVRMGFYLTPAGEINQVTVLQSSGIDELDSAAENAIKKIVPFTAAKKYLSATEFFSVDVIFNN